MKSSLSVGPDAATEKVLDMGYNGWQIVARFAFFGPVLLLATRRRWPT